MEIVIRYGEGSADAVFVGKNGTSIRIAKPSSSGETLRCQAPLFLGRKGRLGNVKNFTGLNNYREEPFGAQGRLLEQILGSSGGSEAEFLRNNKFAPRCATSGDFHIHGISENLRATSEQSSQNPHQLLRRSSTKSHCSSLSAQRKR